MPNYRFGMLGSIDSNTGSPDLGWDTDQFPMDIRNCTAIMKVHFVTRPPSLKALSVVGNWPHLQYIPRNMLHLTHCILWFSNRSIWPILIRVVSRALGQSYDCPNASEATLKNIKIKVEFGMVEGCPPCCCRTEVREWLEGLTVCGHFVTDTVRSRYIAVYFLLITHERHP